MHSSLKHTVCAKLYDCVYLINQNVCGELISGLYDGQALMLHLDATVDSDAIFIFGDALLIKGNAQELTHSCIPTDKLSSHSCDLRYTKHVNSKIATSIYIF